MHNTSRVWTKRTQKANAFIFMTWVVVLAFVTWCFQVMTQDTIWSFALDAPRQAVDISGRMIPPNFPYINELLWPIWETINIATLGTLLGIVIAIPIAFLAARNTTPSANFIRPIALFIIVASR